MILFMCETNTQLLNAINIKLKLFNDKEADLCLCCTNENISKTKEKVEQLNFFNNVYELEIPNYADQSFISMAKKIIRGMNYDRFVGERLPNKGKAYSEIFVAGPGLKCISVYYFFRKKNRHLKLSLYEEGLFEYYMFTSKKHRFRRPYSKLFFGAYYLDDCTTLYVYLPKFVQKCPKKISIVKIPKLSYQDAELKKTLNIVFDYSLLGMERLINCKCLFLEQQFPTQSENEKQKKLIRQLSCNYTKAEFIIKLHPLSPINKYDGVNVSCIKMPQTMEMIFLNGLKKDIQLISICSTAVFTPYLMFNYCTEVKLLYKLFDSLTIEPMMLSVIEEFVNNYPKNAAHVIESINEIGENCD